jgi:hypothetical protein
MTIGAALQLAPFGGSQPNWADAMPNYQKTPEAISSRIHST